MKYSAFRVTFLAIGIANFAAIFFAASSPAKASPAVLDVLGTERPAAASWSGQAALITLGLAQDGTVISAVSLEQFNSHMELTSEDSDDGLVDWPLFEAEQSGQLWAAEQANDPYDLNAPWDETDHRDYEYSLPQERYGYANGGWHPTISDESGNEYADEMDSEEDADESENQWLDDPSDCDQSQFGGTLVLTDETTCDSVMEESNDDQAGSGNLDDDEADGQLWNTGTPANAEDLQTLTEDEEACDQSVNDQDQDDQAVWESESDGSPTVEEADRSLADEQASVGRCDEGAAEEESEQSGKGPGTLLAVLLQETCRGLDNGLRSLVRQAVRLSGAGR